MLEIEVEIDIGNGKSIKKIGVLAGSRGVRFVFWTQSGESLAYTTNESTAFLKNCPWLKDICKKLDVKDYLINLGVTNGKAKKRHIVNK